MSLPERTPDPTNTQYMRDDTTTKLLNTYDSVFYSILAQTDVYSMLLAVDYAFEGFNIQASKLVERQTEFAVRRGLDYANFRIEQLSPDYDIGDDVWTPADDSTLEELIEENLGYVSDFTEETKSAVAQVIKDNAGKSPVEIAEAIRPVFSAKRARLRSIGHTSLMHAFNESGRRRCKAFGIKKYIFFTSLDPKVCEDPKTLPNNEVVMGCESMHGKEYDIDDTDHMAPIHPECRCTFLPKL